MEVIMLQDVDKVGNKHEVVKVKPGFARNFLIPQGLALVANQGNRNMLRHLQLQEDIKESKRLNEYHEIAKQLAGQTLRIGAKTGTSGKIFGSVTNVQIANAIKDQLGVEIERKKIHIPEEVKTLGTYSADIHLHKEVEAKVAFEVVED